jgi:coronin-1B/1C/6
MSRRYVRESKFRHIYGQTAKAPEIYENIKVTKSSADSTFCCVNPKFLAIITEVTGGGSFLVLPLDKTGRLERGTPQVNGHSGIVTELAWCPHNDNLIASACEDGSIKVWQIPDGGLTEHMHTPIRDLLMHKKRVNSINWHPSANLVLLSAGLDNKVLVWNVKTEEVFIEINSHTDMIYSAVWNKNGSLIATTCKDKMLRVFDPRTGKLIRETRAHDSSKPMKAIFLRDGNIFSSGFSKLACREYALWHGTSLNCIMSEQGSNGNSLMQPFYDEDINLLYLCAKGDSAIRFYEYTREEEPYIHFLGSFTPNEPQRGICMMPIRGINIAQLEIAK